MGNVYAINLNENDKVNEKQDLPIELLIDLNSVKKQLKEQGAIDKYSVYEQIIIESYFSINSTNVMPSSYTTNVSRNNKVKRYTKDNIEVRETFLNPYEVGQLYDALSRPNIIRNVVDILMGTFTAPFGLTSFLQEWTVRAPLFELKDRNLPGHIIESIDKEEFNRYTVVVSRWYNYPNW